MNAQNAHHRDFTAIRWSHWIPKERATLLYVIRDGQILLIHKKTGIGAGKVNGPGGRIEPGETPRECAEREIEEELCIRPRNTVLAGELSFQFADGHALHGYVYTAASFTGDPRETDEAIPFWESLDSLPYDEMWEDDPLWMPLMIAKQRFWGRFLFDGDRLLGHRITCAFTGAKDSPV